MRVPKSLASETLIVRKSRFIAWADRVDNRQQLKTLLARAKSAYPDARHHCWAYSVFKGRDEGCSDDGEPKGTAGRPMLTVLQHADVSNVGVVVIRYFGGTKLGTGGLARAYSDATKEVLDALQSEHYHEYVQFEFQLSFSEEQPLRHLIAQYNAECGVIYSAGGIEVSVSVSDADSEPLKDSLRASFPALKFAIAKDSIK